MTSLPSHIEEYLKEAGFASTEILVIRRLLEGDALTLRELASKTGKSTGVLDQATKKLLRKNILTKESINDSPKYVLSSLESIMHWVKQDVAQREGALKRKQKDFESFIASFSLDKSRPEMEYFEGEDGFKKAYKKILDVADHHKVDILSYEPMTFKEDEDPLREFKVEYFRERRRRKIFKRVIAPNTPLGRRYHSRDSFEYRETVLVPENHYPFLFEQIIVGDTFACFDHQRKKVCFIRFPEFSESERGFFETAWEQHLDLRSSSLEERDKHSHANISTITLSAIREFFLSKKSLAVFIGCGLLSVLLTYGLYKNNLYLNLQRIREQAIAIAATAAPEFHYSDLAEIRTMQDINKSEWKDLIQKLQKIREQNKQVEYAYILRPTSLDHIFEFIADADSLDPDAIIDLNDDGQISDADALNPPGDQYDVSEMDALMHNLYTEPVANKTAYTDKWGTFITGYAPIRDDKDTIVGILSIDINASEVEKITINYLLLSSYLFGFFIIFIFARMAAFNRSFYRELLQKFRVNK